VVSAVEAPIKPGNTLPLRNIPVGTTIHCIEMVPARVPRWHARPALRFSCWRVKAAMPRCGCAPARFAACMSSAVRRSARSATRKTTCAIGKAGAQRWRGIRPTVRGVAMNPIDHPHGGGEGKTGAGRVPVSPWGTPTKGYRTRRNKRTDGMIVQRRHKK
jgi:large subunit ribosomal protein L2